MLEKTVFSLTASSAAANQGEGSAGMEGPLVQLDVKQMTVFTSHPSCIIGV